MKSVIKTDGTLTKPNIAGYVVLRLQRWVFCPTILFLIAKLATKAALSHEPLLV